jgi:hypothetical protein
MSQAPVLESRKVTQTARGDEFLKSGVSGALTRATGMAGGGLMMGLYTDYISGQHPGDYCRDEQVFQYQGYDISEIHSFRL